MHSPPAPHVTVLMPAHNAAHTLAASLESVLHQRFTSFEVLVIDDGSTDRTTPLVADFAAADPRVRLVSRRPHLGLVATLNEGLALARGALVARLDADDRALPGRLERQVVEFDDPTVVLCATAYRRVRPNGERIRDAHIPTTHGALAAALTVANRLCHSSVMFRADAVRDVGGYREQSFPAEDYDLWVRLLRHGEFRCVDEVLAEYTENPDGISSNRVQEQQAMCEKIRAEYTRQHLEKHHSAIGRPRVSLALLRALGDDLTSRGIPTTGLAEECYRIAVAGPGRPSLRRLRLLSAPGLLRGRVR